MKCNFGGCGCVNIGNLLLFGRNLTITPANSPINTHTMMILKAVNNFDEMECSEFNNSCCSSGIDEGCLLILKIVRMMPNNKINTEISLTKHGDNIVVFMITYVVKHDNSSAITCFSNFKCLKI